MKIIQLISVILLFQMTAIQSSQNPSLTSLSATWPNRSSTASLLVLGAIVKSTSEGLPNGASSSSAARASTDTKAETDSAPSPSSSPSSTRSIREKLAFAGISSLNAEIPKANAAMPKAQTEDNKESKKRKYSATVNTHTLKANDENLKKRAKKQKVKKKDSDVEEFLPEEDYDQAEIEDVMLASSPKYEKRKNNRKTPHSCNDCGRQLTFKRNCTRHFATTHSPNHACCREFVDEFSKGFSAQNKPLQEHINTQHITKVLTP